MYDAKETNEILNIHWWIGSGWLRIRVGLYLLVRQGVSEPFSRIPGRRYPQNTGCCAWSWAAKRLTGRRQAKKPPQVTHVSMQPHRTPFPTWLSSLFSVCCICAHCALRHRVSRFVLRPPSGVSCYCSHSVFFFLPPWRVLVLCSLCACFC